MVTFIGLFLYYSSISCIELEQPNINNWGFISYDLKNKLATTLYSHSYYQV